MQSSGFIWESGLLFAADQTSRHTCAPWHRSGTADNAPTCHPGHVGFSPTNVRKLLPTGLPTPSPC
jgi:hypothetical protein